MTNDTDRTIISRDFQNLSLFRIVISAYLLGDFFINVYPYFGDFFGDDGVLPLVVLAGNGNEPGLGVVLPVLKVLNFIQFGPAFAALYAAAVLAFASGFRTRWANGLVFVLNGYLYWRNPIIVSGAETLAHLLLLWCLFLPMSRYWSFDAALDPESRRRSYPALPFLALRLQIASLYLFAALFKIAGLPWQHGVALMWSLGDNVFGSTPSGLLLINHAPALLYAADYLVMAFQLAFPFLVYCPWRNDLVRAVALAGSVAMHTSFIFFLNVGGFPYVCLAMLLLLAPDSWIDRLLHKRRAKLSGVAIYYEPSCTFCQRISLILREMLLAPASPVAPASTDQQAYNLLMANNSWVVRGADGKYHLKWRAMDYLLKLHPLLAPAGWLFERDMMQSPMARLYDMIAANRRRLAPIARVLLPFRVARPIGKPALALCGLLMALALTSNVFGLARLAFPALARFDEITAIFQVKQRWEVFAPGPTHFQRDYRLIAHMADGSTIDVMTLVPAPVFRMNNGVRVDFASPRWVKYYTRFDEFTEQDWTAFGRYLCRQMRSHIPSPSSVRQIELTVVTRPIKGTPPAQTPLEHRVFECSRSAGAAARTILPSHGAALL
jgi:hypothetical protein